MKRLTWKTEPGMRSGATINPTHIECLLIKQDGTTEEVVLPVKSWDRHNGYKHLAFPAVMPGQRIFWIAGSRVPRIECRA